MFPSTKNTTPFWYSKNVKVEVNSCYPFGSILSSVSKGDEKYRFGFNNMEKDDEIKGQGNSYDFGNRIYDPRLGRWLSPDPYEVRYPSTSTYAYALNNPIFLIDPSGDTVTVYVTAKKVGKTKINLYSSDEIKKNPSLKNKTITVAVYEVKVTNQSGSEYTFYYTRNAYRGKSDGTTEDVTFDVINNGDQFLGKIKSRWSGKDNVLELRPLDNFDSQTVKGLKAGVKKNRKAIQFHVKGASDGCLLAVGSGQFECTNEDIDTSNLTSNSSGSQTNFMNAIKKMQKEDKDEVIIIKFETGTGTSSGTGTGTGTTTETTGQ
jgi:RHS repeat-associated protein